MSRRSRPPGKLPEGIVRISEPLAEIMERVCATVRDYDTVTTDDSERLVGVERTARIREACRYCYGLDDVGVPEWVPRVWLGLLTLIIAAEGRR